MAWSFGKLLNWFRRRGATPAEPPGTEKALPASSQPSVGALRAALGFMGPGWWASDHAEEASHFTGWNYIAIHTKAVMASQASVAVYRKARSGRPWQKSFDPTRGANQHERTPLPDTHPYVRLLERPNPRFSGAFLRYLILQQQGLTGGARIWMVPNSLGLPCELWVIPTALARPQPPSRIYPEGSYWVSATGLYTAFLQDVPAALGIGQQSGVTIDARWVRTIGWPHPVYLGDCQSPTGAMGVQIDLAEMLDQATHAGLENTVRAGLLLSLDAEMKVTEKEIERAERKINELKGGPQNTGRTIILQGARAEQTNRPVTDLDYVQGRTQARDNVMAGHQTSPVAAGVVGASSFAEYIGGVRQTTDLSVQPALTLTAQELTAWLGGYWGGDLELEFQAKSISDPAELEQRLSTDIAAGNAVRVNEYRAIRGMPPIDGELGQQFIGVRTTARTMDADPEKPGLQGGQGSTLPGMPAGPGTAAGGKVPGLDARAERMTAGLQRKRLRQEIRREVGLLLKGFDPSEERDDGGKWTAGGEGGKGSDSDWHKTPEVHGRIKEHLRSLPSEADKAGQRREARWNAVRRVVEANRQLPEGERLRGKALRAKAKAAAGAAHHKEKARQVEEHAAWRKELKGHVRDAEGQLRSATKSIRGAAKSAASEAIGTKLRSVTGVVEKIPEYREILPGGKLPKLNPRRLAAAMSDTLAELAEAATSPARGSLDEFKQALRDASDHDEIHGAAGGLREVSPKDVAHAVLDNLVQNESDESIYEAIAEAIPWDEDRDPDGEQNARLVGALAYSLTAAVRESLLATLPEAARKDAEREQREVQELARRLDRKKGFDPGESRDEHGMWTGGGSGGGKPAPEHELRELHGKLSEEAKSPKGWKRVVRAYKLVRASMHVAAVKVAAALAGHASDILPVVEDTSKPWFNPAGMRGDPVRDALGIGGADAAVIASHVLAKVATWVKGKPKTKGSARPGDRHAAKAVLVLLQALREGLQLDHAELPSLDEVLETIRQRRAA